MAGVKLLGLVLAVVVLQGVYCFPETNEASAAKTKPDVPCDVEDNYCRGESFQERIPFMNRLVTCNKVPDPKKNCCIPHKKHRVCYDILIDGNKLNIDLSSSMANTDFSALCAAMVNYFDEEPDTYVTAYTADGDGTLRYNLDSIEVVKPSGKYIKHLACSVKE